VSDPFDPHTGLPSADPDFVQAMPVEEPRRAASLMLRADDARDSRAVSMDAANKSLADALAIIYRLLQAVMLTLLLLFLFSGFQQVNQAETGIRVDLGQIKAADLEPGFQFSLPYPLGEIIKVERGNRSLRLDDSFWPKVPESLRGRSIDELNLSASSLKPAEDGSLLTADANIAHAQWTVIYSVARARNYIQNFFQDPDRKQERNLVRAAVERAAVRVVAETSIDDLLKRGGLSSSSTTIPATPDPGNPDQPQPTPPPHPPAPPPASTAAADATKRENSVEAQVRRIAQETLDSVDSGIDISQVLLNSASPPIRVRKTFNDVQIAQSAAAKLREQALQDRNKALTAAAGSAAPALLHAIDRYEFALALDDQPESQRLFSLITSILEGDKSGRAVDIEGQRFDEIVVGGEVASLISDAQQYRSTIVQKAQRQAETFATKLRQFHANPIVFASSEWTDAFIAFMANPNLEVMILPAGAGALELLLTSDPEFARDAERQRYESDIDSNLRLQKMPNKK